MTPKSANATYYDVVGIGNAIVDVMAKVGDGFLSFERKKFTQRRHGLA